MIFSGPTARPSVTMWCSPSPSPPRPPTPPAAAKVNKQPLLLGLNSLSLQASSGASRASSALSARSSAASAVAAARPSHSRSSWRKGSRSRTGTKGLNEGLVIGSSSDVIEVVMLTYSQLSTSV